MYFTDGGFRTAVRKIFSGIALLALLVNMLAFNPSPVSAKTAFSDPAPSLIVNLLNPDGTTTLVHEYLGEVAGSYEAGGEIYNYYTYPELEALATIDYYATIDAMPAAVGTKARGVTIKALVNDAKKYNPNIKWESGQKLVMYPTDASTYPYQGVNYYNYDFVQGQARYYYPNLVEAYTLYRANDEDPSYLENALDNPVSVEPMFATAAFQERYTSDGMLKSKEAGTYSYGEPGNADYREIITPVQLDSYESLRFCFGLTPTEAQNGLDGTFSSTNKFCRWAYRVDFGPVNGPSLTADTTDNIVDKPIEITFTDKEAWRNAITGITVNGTVIDKSHYMIAPGSITFDSTVFTTAGSHEVVATAADFMNTKVTQVIKGTGAASGTTSGTTSGIASGTASGSTAAPALTASETSSVGQAVDLSFTDNADWRAAISKITVDGVALTGGQYTVEAGKISIVAGVMNTAGDHTLVIKAAGFKDAAVTQKIVNGTVNPETVNPGGDNTAYNQAALATLSNPTPQQSKNAQLADNASTVSQTEISPVVLTTNDGFQLIVPPGAVGNRTAPVQMSVALGSVQTPPKAESAAVMLDPLKYQRQLTIKNEADGTTQFNVPVTIAFSVATSDLPAGITPQQLAVYQWNSGRNDWVKLGGVYDSTDQTISVTTYHFSTYAVMADTSTTLDRLAGYDRFETAIAIAEQGWKAGADNVVLANGYLFPDALAATPLAYKLNAPILLTDAAVLTPATWAEIQKLAPKTITLVGGTAVISQAIEDFLSAACGSANVRRIAGMDRYETAAAVAAALGTTGKAVITNGEDGHYADALAISSYAAYHGMPVLFTEAAGLPAATAQALTAQKVSATIVAGGESVVPTAVYQQLPGASRYAGFDCYATATAIADGLDLNRNKVYVVTGLNFPDALVASNLAAHTSSPLIMVDKGLPDATCTFLASNRSAINSLIKVGGEGIITAAQNSAMQAAMK